MRGVSDFGFYVYIIFEDGTDIYWARSRTLEYLSNILPRLPQGVNVEVPVMKRRLDGSSSMPSLTRLEKTILPNYVPFRIGISDMLCKPCLELLRLHRSAGLSNNIR